MATSESSATYFRGPVDPQRGGLLGAGRILRKRSGCFERNFPDYALVYLTEGGGNYEDRRQGKLEIRQGDAIVVFPGLVHSYYVTTKFETWSEYWLIFNGALFRQLEEDGLFTRARPVLRPGYSAQLVSSFRELLSDYQASPSPEDPTFTARTHLLLAEICRRDLRRQEQGGVEAFRQAACALLEEDLEGRLDLGPVARVFGLSAERFRKKFAAAVGVPPARYRMLRRIDRAKRLLLETGLSVKEIAYRLEFCDPYFFSRQFRGVTGQSPTEFRAMG